MRRNLYARLAIALVASAALLDTARPTTDAAPRVPTIALNAAPAALDAAPVAFSPEPQSNNVNVNGFFSVDPAQQGSTFQAAVVMEIPAGVHVNSNRPLGKYAVPTVLKVDAPKGLKLTPLSYPRSTVRSFRFGAGAPEERLAVYEGRAIFRFFVNVPANYEMGVARIRVNVRFQSCNDEVCFPPATRELVLPIAIVGHDTPINHINAQYFGSGVRKRRG
jgi:DsbC/DsbD-like thiol-disulfide interchange protein